MEEKQPLLIGSGTNPPSWDSFNKQKEFSQILGSDSMHVCSQETVKIQTKLQFSNKKLGVVLCILSIELCEKLSFYSVLVNLVLFCTSVLKYSSNDAATISLVFSGTLCFLPVVGGYIADSRAGMFNTIYGSALIYLLGLALLSASAVDYEELLGSTYTLDLEDRRVFFILSLLLIAVGAGGIKASVGTFGAQQVQHFGPEAVQTFFNWYYWFICAGALIAESAVATVQQNFSFALGYLIPFVSMLFAIFFLLLARKHYIHKHLAGSLFVDAFQVCFEGCIYKASSKNKNKNIRFFDGARSQNGGSFGDETVDGIISVVRILPILLFLVIFWTIYFQMQTTFFIQGERMDLSIGNVQVPVGITNLFNTTFLMLLIPILDRVIYPCFSRWGRPLSHLQRVGIGLLVAVLSMVAAGVVEIKRKEQFGFTQVVGGEEFFASNLTIFTQIPQFALIGASETFASISGLEFAYTHSPANMQGLMMGIFWVNMGLGSYLSTAILKVLEVATAHDPWFPDEINDGHAEYVFFLLAGMTGVCFLGFLLVAALYKPPEKEKSEENMFSNLSTSQQSITDLKEKNNDTVVISNVDQENIM